MRFKWAYIPMVFICALLFSIPTYAAQTSNQATITSNGTTYTATTYSNTNITASSSEYYIDTTNNTEYMTNSYNVSFPVFITGSTNGNYLNGYFNIRINKTQTGNNLVQSSSILRFTNTESLKVFMGPNTQNYIFLYVFLDNFYVSGSAFGIGEIEEIYTQNRLNPDQTTTYASFNNAILFQAGNIQSTEYPQDNGLAHIISNSVGYAISSASEFDDINTMLTAIRDQDALYYTSLTTACANILAQTTISNTKLQQLIEDNNANFSAVQNILALFPSYRTLVLQYWQELLQMNAAQSSQAAENESQYQDKESQSESLVAGMGDLSMPSISSNDLDIFSQTDSGTRANFFGLIAMITHNDFIVRIFLIVATASLIGFILYGKKG